MTTGGCRSFPFAVDGARPGPTFPSALGRFDQRSTRPQRSLKHILRWKVVDGLAGRNHRDRERFVPPHRANDGAVLADPGASLTWVGHASFVLKLGGRLIATDPNWNRYVAIRRRTAPPGLPLGSLVGKVDVVVVSHNHRDHMDLWTLRQIARDATVVVPLGNRDGLRSVPAKRVVELDWWQTHREGPLDITLVPARHWSMRTPFDRNDALWGGFLIRGPEGTAYHSGDTAMFDGFEEIGKRAGSIDWAMLPIGAYEPRWFMGPQHICPEEAGAAFEMLAARHLVAMHWGTFRLTDEPMGEPPQRLLKWAEERGYGPDRVWVLDVGETRML